MNYTFCLKCITFQRICAPIETQLSPLSDFSACTAVDATMEAGTKKTVGGFSCGYAVDSF